MSDFKVRVISATTLVGIALLSGCQSAHKDPEEVELTHAQSDEITESVVR